MSVADSAQITQRIYGHIDTCHQLRTIGLEQGKNALIVRLCHF